MRRCYSYLTGLFAPDTGRGETLGLLSRWFPQRHATEKALTALRDEIGREHKGLVRELREIRRTAEQSRQSIDRALAAHEEALAALPELQAKVERFSIAYAHDAKSAPRLDDFKATVNRQAVLDHVTREVERAQLQLSPCPHLVVDHVFPEDVYDRLIESLPAPVFFEKTDDLRDEMPVPFTMAPAYSRVVWELFHEAIERALLPGAPPPPPPAPPP